MKRLWTNLVMALVCSFTLAGACAFGQSLSAVTLTVSSTALTIYPGEQNVPIAVTVNSGTYAGPVIVTLTGLPTGVTVPPLSLNTGGSGTLNLSATTSAGLEDFPTTVGLSVSSATRTVEVVAVAGATQVQVPLTLTVSLSNPSFAPAPAAINLPKFSIDTNGAAISSTENKISATFSITSADGQTNYLQNAGDTDNTLAIQLHGNSTAEMPKKAYEFKLGTSVDLLGSMELTCPYVKGTSTPICDKSKTYVLLANYDDKTLLRDWAASALANAIPIGNGYLDSPADSPTPSGNATLLPWAPHSLYVELYLNGLYQGSYQLIEKVNVDSHRINITELSESDTTAAEVTGGYFMEIDQRKAEDYDFVTPHGVDIGLQDPDFSPDPEVSAQTDYITNYVDQAEDALYSSTFTDATTGWRAYFDEASAVNFYIVNELMGNGDGGSFYSSDYLYKDANNPMIYMGPIWDFDLSSGNISYDAVNNPSSAWMQVEAPWYKQWFTDPSFKADTATQWNALRNNGVISSWIISIQQQAQALEQTQINNQGRWPMQEITVWPNSQVAGSYDGEVAYLVTYLNARASYMDSILNSKPTTSVTATAPAGTLRTGTSATFSAHVTASSGAPSGTVTFHLYSTNHSNLIVGTVDSSGTATASTSNLVAGTGYVQAIYSGDGTHAMSVSSSVAYTALPAQTNTTSVLAAASSTGSSFTVTVLANSGTVTPTGSVAFTSNGVAIGSATLSAGGTATFAPTTSLPGGSDTIVATYSGDTNYLASTSNSVAVTVAESQAPAPAIAPAAGTYTAAQTVTLADTLTGAAIYYTTDGSGPTASSTLYSAPITVASTETISAIAVASGYTTSTVTTAAYTISLPESATPSPTFAPAAGTYTSAQSVTLADSLSAVKIYYTTNGSTPTASSTLYIAPITVSSTETISAIAIATDYTSSTVTTAAYTISTASADFTVAASASSVTATGDSVAFNLTLTPENGFTQAVTFTCSGQPADDTCTFSPASVTPSGQPVAVAVTVTSSGTTAAWLHGLPVWSRISGGVVVALLFWPFRRRKAWLFVAVAGALSLGSLVTGCGGGSGSKTTTTATPYILTVTATSGSLSQTAQVTVNGLN